MIWFQSSGIPDKEKKKDGKNTVWFDFRVVEYLAKRKKYWEKYCMIWFQSSGIPDKEKKILGKILYDLIWE